MGTYFHTCIPSTQRCRLNDGANPILHVVLTVPDMYGYITVLTSVSPAFWWGGSSFFGGSIAGNLPNQGKYITIITSLGEEILSASQSFYMIHTCSIFSAVVKHNILTNTIQALKHGGAKDYGEITSSSSVISTMHWRITALIPTWLPLTTSCQWYALCCAQPSISHMEPHLTWVWQYPLGII